MNITEVFQSYSAYIYSYALKLTRDINNAEDLTQDVFLIAIDKQKQINNIDSVKYWLRSICFNCYLMKLRKNKNITLTPFSHFDNTHNIDIILLNQGLVTTIDDELIVDEAIKKIQSVCFLSMVHRMKNSQRIIFSLIDMFGLSINEVSNIMNISESAVKSHLHRARKKLDESLLSKCGILDTNNPCSCIAWEKFVHERENRKARIRKKENVVNNKMNDIDREKAIKKIRKLFSEMVDFEPSQEWYEKVIHQLKKILA